MKTLIFGGTTEGRKCFNSLLKDGEDVYISVAEKEGSDLVLSHLDEELLENEDKILKIKERIFIKRLSLDEVYDLIKDFDQIIDATHPYAVLITKNILSSCKKANKPYKRIERKETTEDELKGVDHIFFSTQEDAAAFLLDKDDKNILCLTGSKEINKYKKLNKENFYVRIIDSEKSIENCLSAGVLYKNIIRGMGPFSKEDNEYLIKKYDIKYLITKDSGKEGGMQEKIEACKGKDLLMLIIKRPV